MGQVRRVLKRAAVGVAALTAGLLVTGVVSEAVIRGRVARVIPAPGRLVDIGGRQMQLDCRGSGRPTVVLEAGLDVLGSLSWAAVHDSLAALTRTCAYSRAGIQWSEPSGLPFSVDGVVSDLRETLKRAGEPAPFVLVAHSIGGLYATAFAARHRPDVAGLVLVDASHPDQVARLEAVTGVRMLPAAGDVALAARLARTGVLRFLPVATEPQGAPSWVLGVASARFSVSVAALAAELRALPATFEATRALHVFDDLPFTALVAGAATPPATLRAMGMSAAQGEQMRRAWIALQAERAAWATAGRVDTLLDATHYVQFDRPDAVVGAVKAMLGSLAANPRSTNSNPR